MSVLMAASLTACGGGGDKDKSGGDAKGGDKEIVYWNIGTESPDKDVIAKAVDKFNSETESGYTVTVVPTQNDTYKEKLVVAMSSGECPDMYSCWSGGPMYEYIDSGFGQPIDDLFNNSEIKDKLMESAVGQATYNGKIYAGGVDVPSTEPPCADNPLLTAKNCYITPHIAWATIEARERLMNIAISNLQAYIAGKPENIVNK